VLLVLFGLELHRRASTYRILQPALLLLSYTHRASGPRDLCPLSPPTSRPPGRVSATTASSFLARLASWFRRRGGPVGSPGSPPGGAPAPAGLFGTASSDDGGGGGAPPAAGEDDGVTEAGDAPSLRGVGSFRLLRRASSALKRSSAASGGGGGGGAATTPPAGATKAGGGDANVKAPPAVATVGGVVALDGGGGGGGGVAGMQRTASRSGARGGGRGGGGGGAGAADGVWVDTGMECWTEVRRAWLAADASASAMDGSPTAATPTTAGGSPAATAAAADAADGSDDGDAAAGTAAPSVAASGAADAYLHTPGVGVVSPAAVRALVDARGARRGGSGRGRSRRRDSATALPDVDADELYDELVASSYRPLAAPVPLVQLIPVLIDVWEADGLLG